MNPIAASMIVGGKVGFTWGVILQHQVLVRFLDVPRDARWCLNTVIKLESAGNESSLLFATAEVVSNLI